MTMKPGVYETPYVKIIELTVEQQICAISTVTTESIIGSEEDNDW